MNRMHITPVVKNILETAIAKALATHTQSEVNVVPVSMIQVHEKEIWLFDFFMEKTVANISQAPAAALTAWSKMEGIQLQGTISYHTTGAKFEEAVAFVATQNPDRVVRGLLVFSPKQIFDVSPGGAYTTEELGNS